MAAVPRVISCMRLDVQALLYPSDCTPKHFVVDGCNINGGNINCELIATSDILVVAVHPSPPNN